MSDRPAPTFEEQATVVHGMPVQLPEAKLTALADKVHGRLILRDWGVRSSAQGEPAAHDPFQDLRFGMTEVAEILVLETQARVYEEVTINKEALDRIEAVTATLRQQEAEVVVEDAKQTSAGLPHR